MACLVNNSIKPNIFSQKYLISDSFKEWNPSFFFISHDTVVKHGLKKKMLPSLFQ
jgi:hypothetical protein